MAKISHNLQTIPSHQFLIVMYIHVLECMENMGNFSAIFDPRIFLERTFGGIVSGQYEYYITLPGAHEEKERISHMYNGNIEK